MPALEHVGDAAHGAGEHGCAAGHRLQHRPWCGIAEAGEAEQVRRLLEVEQLGVRRAEPVHTDARALGHLRGRPEVQLHRVAELVSQRLEQILAALLSEPPAYEQHARALPLAAWRWSIVVEVDAWMVLDDARAGSLACDRCARPLGPGQ